MLNESFILTYDAYVLATMSDAKREIFDGPLRKYVIATTKLSDTRKIVFHFYQDHFLEVVAKWPWLLLSDLGMTEETNNLTDAYLTNSSQWVKVTKP